MKDVKGLIESKLESQLSYLKKKSLDQYRELKEKIEHQKKNIDVENPEMGLKDVVKNIKEKIEEERRERETQIEAMKTMVPETTSNFMELDDDENIDTTTVIRAVERRINAMKSEFHSLYTKRLISRGHLKGVSADELGDLKDNVEQKFERLSIQLQRQQETLDKQDDHIDRNRKNFYKQLEDMSLRWSDQIKLLEVGIFIMIQSVHSQVRIMPLNIKKEYKSYIDNLIAELKRDPSFS